MLAGITFATYDSRWQILYLKGYFWSESPSKSITVTIKGKGNVGRANLGWRYIDKRFLNDRNQGFIFEKRLPFELRYGDMIEIHCEDEAGGHVTAGKEYVDSAQTQQRQPVASNESKGNARPTGIGFIREGLRAGTKSLLQFSRAFLADPSGFFTRRKTKKRLLDRENIVMLAIHNLDVEERKVKLDCFEKIDAALQSWGWKILIAHHSFFDLKTTMDFVQVLKVKIPWRRRSAAWLKAPGVQEALLEATTLLHGHYRGLKIRRPWEECYDQVIREADIVDYLMRTRRPYLCILWHQWNSYATMNRFLCEVYQIPFIYAHEGFLADTLGLDPYGEMAESLPAVDHEKFNSLPIDANDMQRADNYLTYLRQENLDRKMQTDRGAVDEIVAFMAETKGRPVLFYAGVNDFQTGMLPVWRDGASLHSPIFVDTYDALSHLYDLCEKNDWYVIFKPHPNTPPRDVEQFGSRIIMLRSANIIECVECTDLTITLVSTVGYVSLVHKKPVVMVGRNTLSESGAVHNVAAIDDVETAITSVLKDKEALPYDNFRTHVARLLKYYLYPYSNKSKAYLEKDHADAARFILKQIENGHQAVYQGLDK